MPINTASLEALACDIKRGDKQAQLELGKRYEQGLGITQDYKQARNLYEQAARTLPNTIYVYSPPGGTERAGRVIPISSGAQTPGLAEARYRLGNLYIRGLGVKPDPEYGQKLRRAATEAGYVPDR
jgi:TPR repeat protein